MFLIFKSILAALWQSRLWPVSNTSACMQGKCTIMFLQEKLTLQREKEKEREGEGVVRCLNSPRLMFHIWNRKRCRESFHDKSLRLSTLQLGCGSWAPSVARRRVDAWLNVCVFQNKNGNIWESNRLHIWGHRWCISSFVIGLHGDTQYVCTRC